MVGNLSMADGMFLGREELQRQQEMTRSKENYISTAVGYGIRSPRDFEVTKGLGSVNNIGTVQIPESFGMDIQGRPIYFQQNTNIYIGGNGTYHLTVRYGTKFIERGVVKVNVQETGALKTGTVTGENTEFMKLFRPVSSNYKQNRIELYQIQDNGEPGARVGQYEIVNVSNDTNMVITGNFPANTDMTKLCFMVVGTFSQDIVPTNNDRFTYRYDKCELRVYPDSNFVRPGAGVEFGSGLEFYIAEVTISGLNVTVTDKRELHCRYIDTQEKIIRLRYEFEQYMDVTDDRLGDLEAFQNNQESKTNPNFNSRIEYLESILGSRLGDLETGLEEMGNLPELIKESMPKGVIVMWSGTSNTVPKKWALCDGSTVPGYGQTPNLQGRFIVGAGVSNIAGSYNVGSTGGKLEHILTESNIPKHNHVNDTRFNRLSARASDINNMGTPGSIDDKTPLEEYRVGAMTTSLWTASTIKNFGEEKPSELDNRPPYYVLAYIIKIE
jgi:microcystin-dependent protein